MNLRVAKAMLNYKYYDFGVKIQVGRLIPVYANPKLCLSDPKILKVVAQEYAKVIKKIRPKIKVIAGGESGGISLAAVTALELNLPWVYIRKKAKGYSTNVLVEGDYQKGDRAVLVDDVIATGSSKELFIMNAKNKLVIKDIIVILGDNNGDYPAWIKKRKIRVYEMFMKKDRDKYLHQVGFFNDNTYKLEQAYGADRDHWQDNPDNWKLYQKVKKHYQKTGKL
ncbi:MAG: phosphoribosyltransferase family protein [bacterium]